MSTSLRDRVAGAALLVLALVWIVLVYLTIEPSQDAAAGPRAFPLFFGFALAVLALAVLLQSFRPRAAAREPDPVPAGPSEPAAVVATIGSIVVYGALLEPLGFIPSTALVVALMMVLVLRVTAPLMVAAMAIGLSLGCYLVFGKLLGTYLPPGTWITIHL
jgi:putative tricarboxylic transport membrane protein